MTHAFLWLYSVFWLSANVFLFVCTAFLLCHVHTVFLLAITVLIEKWAYALFSRSAVWKLASSSETSLSVLLAWWQWNSTTTESSVISVGIVRIFCSHLFKLFCWKWSENQWRIQHFWKIPCSFVVESWGGVKSGRSNLSGCGGILAQDFNLFYASSSY